MQVYLGTIVQFSFNYAPEQWLPCYGQTLLISQYNDLYNLIGTRYGGDGVETFCIPDLRIKNFNGLQFLPGPQHYETGEVMQNGLTYIDSYICIQGDYPIKPL